MTKQKCCLTLGWDTIGWDNISPDEQSLGIDLSPVGEKVIPMCRYTSQSRLQNIALESVTDG